MGTHVKLRIEGFGDLRRALDRVAGGAEQVLADAAMAGAMPVVGLVAQKAPVRTGNLRRSYHAELTERRRTRVVVTIGTDVEYAKYVELGTSRMGAQPHLRPGVEQGAAMFVREAARVVGRAIGAAA